MNTPSFSDDPSTPETPGATATLPSPAAETGKAPKARRLSAQEKLDKLQKQMAEAKEALREAEKKRCTIVGAAVLAELDTDADLKRRIAQVLRRRITSNADKAEIADLLI